MKTLIGFICGIMLCAGIVAVAHGGTCFLTGETTDGFNKICYYDCLSGTMAITVGAMEFCPLSIND